MMGTNVNEGLTPERVDALIEWLADEGEWLEEHCGKFRLEHHTAPDDGAEVGKRMKEAAATIAELRAELDEVEERLREAGQEHDDMMVRLERAEAEMEEAKRNTQWRAVTAVSEENERLAAELERKDAALRETQKAARNLLNASRAFGVLGATEISEAEEWLDRALTSTPEAATVEVCYCTPGVYTPSAMCPVHGATSTPEGGEHG